MDKGYYLGLMFCPLLLYVSIGFCQIKVDLIIAGLLRNSRMVDEDYHLCDDRVQQNRTIVITCYWRSDNLIESSWSVVGVNQLLVGLDW